MLSRAVCTAPNGPCKGRRVLGHGVLRIVRHPPSEADWLSRAMVQGLDGLAKVQVQGYETEIFQRFVVPKTMQFRRPACRFQACHSNLRGVVDAEADSRCVFTFGTGLVV